MQSPSNPEKTEKIFNEFLALPDKLEVQLEFIKVNKDILNDFLQKTKHNLTKSHESSSHLFIFNTTHKIFKAHAKNNPLPTGYRAATVEDITTYITEPAKKFLKLLDIFYRIEALLLPFYTLFESSDNLTLKKADPLLLAKKARLFANSKNERVKFMQHPQTVLLFDPATFEMVCLPKPLETVEKRFALIDLPQMAERHFFLMQCDKIEAALLKDKLIKK